MSSVKIGCFFCYNFYFLILIYYFYLLFFYLYFYLSLGYIFIPLEKFASSWRKLMSFSHVVPIGKVVSCELLPHHTTFSTSCFSIISWIMPSSTFKLSRWRFSWWRWWCLYSKSFSSNTFLLPDFQDTASKWCGSTFKYNKCTLDWRLPNAALR